MADFWEQFADAPITQNNKSDNFWEQFDNPTPSRDLGKWGVETELRQAPKRNLLTDFKDCLNWVGNTTMAAYQEGKNQTETAHLEMRDMVGVISDTQKERLNTLNNTPQHDYQLNEKKYIDENITNVLPRTATGFKKAYIETIKQIPIIWETIKAGGVGYAVGAGAGATVGTGIGLATTKANTPQLALQGAKVGGAWGGRITGAMKIAEIEGGLARNELKQINEEIKEKGGEPLDKLEIDALALSVGAVNAGLEMVSLKQLLKTVPGGDAILESLEKKSLRELAMDKTVREQLHGVLAQYSKAIAAEVSTEMLQETTNIVAEHYAQKLGKVECTPLEKNVARVIDTGKATFGATMFLGGFTSAAKATTILAKQGMTKTEAEQAVANMTPEEINEVIENNIDTLFKSVEDIPTVKEQEDKTKLRDAYFEQIKNTGMEETEALNNATLMSEAFAALAKNTGVNLDDIEKEANIVIQNMSDEQAQQQYETDNSAAKSDITFNNETKENLIENELGRLYEEFSSLPEDYADENDILNRISNMQILEDLQNGLVSEENIQAIQNIISEYEKTNPELATFLKDAAERVGNILGLKEVEFQKIEQPKYQKIETAGAENNETALARQEWKKKGTESKYFKKWFGNSKVVDKEGKPLVVYHGSRNQFEEFKHIEGLDSDANSINTKEAFFFVDDDYAADRFAEIQRDAQIMRLQAEKHVGSGYNNLAEKQRLDEEIKKQSYNDNIRYNVYLSIQNPLMVDFEGKEYNTEEVDDLITRALDNGNDGVIIKNIDDEGGVHTQYAVFNPEQIKSVDNQGTFDEKNPNIYYQLIGEKGAERYSGEAIQDLEEAKQLEAKGWHQNRIFEKTGWIRGADKKWRYEISDNDAEITKSEEELRYKELPDNLLTYEEFDKKLTELNERLNELVGQKSMNEISKSDFEEKYYNTMDERTKLIRRYETDKEKQYINRYYLDEILKHDKLFKAYPRLHTLVVNITKNEPFKAAAGVFKGNSIGIADRVITSGRLKEVLMHEIQHYIQDAEDFNWGGNPESVEKQIRYALDAVEKTETEQKRKDLIAMAEVESKDRFVIGAALQTLRMHEKEEALFKSWWWSKYGSWYIPRKTRKKEYRSFMNEWTQKYLTSMWDIMRERGQETEYRKYLDMDINEVRRLYRNIDAKINRIWKRTPRDIAHNFRRALDKLENTEGEYSLSQLKIELYKQLAGEVEARNTENRINMTEEERRQKSPKFTQDVEDNFQLVVFSDGSTLSYSATAQYDAAKSDNVEQTKVYFQGINDDINSNINNARGFTYQRKNFDGTEKENLIVLLNKKADKSTLMHEFAHVYLITLNNLAQHNDRAKELLMTVNQWLHYDGVEYTEFQHERFANNFVAYVKSGRAPSYGLKKVFENFRRWLNDMYSDLQESEDVFIDPETAKVFDELLGNITINAQKAEAEQIVNKANTNAKLRYANELDAQKKKVKINQLTEYQKRYRDTAYDILWYALNNSKKDGKPLIKDKRQLYMLFGQSAEQTKKNKGVIKQAEKLAEFLAELDDVFSAGDGMLPEWREFFTDTITEDSDDASLALAALDVIMDRDYENAYPYEYDEHGNLSEGDIAETNYALDVLIEEYKNADDKTIPLLAYNEWFKHVHFYIHEDIQKKWETATNEIDRYEALDNFEKAKEDLKLYAATLKGYGDYSTQFAEYARKIVKRLDFMTESDKGKLFDKLKEFNSFRDIERNLDDVMDYAKTLADVSDRRALAEQIDKEVRQTIHTWQNGIKKTKYTYPANKLFERLREINKMSSSTVQDMYDAYLNEEETPDYTDDTVHEKEYYSLIEELFVKYKINGIYYSSTEFLQDLLQRLQNAKYTAKIARDEIDFERRMKRLNKVDECAKALNKRKSEIEENPVIKKAGKVNAAGFNFNGALKMIFNDSIKDWASLDYLYAKRDAQVGKDRKEFLEKAKKIFGYSGKFGDVKLFNRFIDMTQKYYTITQRHSPDIEQGSYRITSQMPETGFNATQYTQQIRQDMEFAEEWKPMQVELSKMEVLYYYIQAKNPTSYVILTDKDKGQFDKYDFDTMLDSLTEQEKLLGDVMQLAAEKYWNALNAYHVKKYHTDLGKVKGYFPRLSDTQDVKMLDMFNDYVAQTSNGKFQKQRTAGPGIRIKSANALAVLFDHIEKANTVITMGEHLDDINAVFSNPDLKKLMENIWGEDITKEFYGQLTGNLFTGQTLTKSLQEKWYGSVIGNLIKTNLFLKPQIGIKQLISFMNYGKGDEYVSPEEWWSRFIKQTLTPSEWKKNIDFMMENDYLRDRFYRGGSMDALKKELDTRFFSKLSLLDEFWSKPIQLGDIGAIILGGKPYIDALMDKGYTKEQAFRIFIETTVNDQQSSIPSTLSNMQRNSNKNPLAKMAFAYQNTPWQYYRQCTNAIMKALQSKEKPDIKRASKMLVLYGWLFPALFNMASSLSLLTFMSGGGDDDLLKDINPLRTITSVLTQHPILGEWIKGILNASEGKQYYSNDLISKHVKSINKLIRDFKKDKLTLKDFWDCLIAFAESAGAPLGSLSNAASGVFDIIQGDVMKGAIKTLGYSDYRAKVVTGEE